MSTLDNKTRLLHILNAASKVVKLVENKTFQELEDDEVLTLALVKLIEIVGEASSRLSKEFQAKHPEIPWPGIIGMRNRLVHAYFDINLKVIWQTTQEDLPALIEQLKELPEIQ
ncbi:MAG: DUF86 domain-containing protein [Crocosphaera sp.]